MITNNNWRRNNKQNKITNEKDRQLHWQTNKIPNTLANKQNTEYTAKQLKYRIHWQTNKIPNTLANKQNTEQDKKLIRQTSK